MAATAKTYTMKSPGGDIVTFHNMGKFCKENNLTHSLLHRVYAGQKGRNHHRGWTRVGSDYVVSDVLKLPAVKNQSVESNLFKLAMGIGQ